LLQSLIGVAPEGRLYWLPHVLLVSIFAIVSGANSYRGIHTYFRAHLRALNKAFKIKWKRAPAHTRQGNLSHDPTDI
jgi:hypothetical protein